MGDEDNDGMRPYDSLGEFYVCSWRDPGTGNVILWLALQRETGAWHEYADDRRFRPIMGLNDPDFLRKGAFLTYGPYVRGDRAEVTAAEFRSALCILAEMERPWSAQFNDDRNCWDFQFWNATDAVEFKLRCP